MGEQAAEAASGSERDALRHSQEPEGAAGALTKEYANASQSGWHGISEQQADAIRLAEHEAALQHEVVNNSEHGSPWHEEFPRHEDDACEFCQTMDCADPNGSDCPNYPDRG